MANNILRDEAIKMRLGGATYSQIKSGLGVSKSTLSSWLRNLTLNEEQLKKLSANKLLSKDARIEAYINTRKKQKLERLQLVLEGQKNSMLPLSERELFIAGIFLYWGEGEKRHGCISISNTDPRIVKFALYWMTEILKISKNKIRANLHLYRDMNILESINYWAKELDLPRDQFRKPYIKKSNKEGLTYKSFGHGTCRLYAGNTSLSEKVAMSIKAVSDQYGSKSDIFWYN